MSSGDSNAIYTFDELMRIRDAKSTTLPSTSLQALREAGILREIIDSSHHTTPASEESHQWKASSEGSWRTSSNTRIMDTPDPQTPTSLTTPTTPTPPQPSNTLTNRSAEAFKPRTPLTETERMVKEVKGLLNKITPQKYEAIAPQIVRFFDANTSSTIIPLIFEKAFHEMAFCEMYADLFCDLHGKMATTAQSHTSLLLALRLRCDLELKKALVSDEAEATSSESSGEKKLKRSVGISQFIAELFLRDILQEDVLFQWACRLLCINTATNNATPASTTETLPTELQVEVACKMIETCGQQWENSSPRFLSTILPAMQRLHSNSSKPRMGFMIQDVLESRKAGWAKRFKKEKPSKISERTGTLTSTTVRRSITPPARPMVIGLDDAYRMRGRTPPPRANRPIPLLPINPTPPGSAPTSPIPIGMRAAPGSPVPGPLLMHHSAPNTPNIPVVDLSHNNWSMSTYQQFQEQPVYHTHSYPYSPEQRFSHYQAALDQYQDPNGWSSPPTNNNQHNPPWQSTNTTGQSHYSPGDHYRQNWQSETEQRRPAENWRSTTNRTSSSCPSTPAPSAPTNKPVFSPPQLGQMSPQSSPSHTPTASPSHPTNPMPPSPNTPTPLPRTLSGSNYGGPRRNSPPRWIPVEPPAPLPAKSKPGSFK